MKKDKNLKSVEELKREFYEGMRELKDSQKQTAEGIKELKDSQKQTAEGIKELKDSQKKTDEQLKKTDDQQKKTNDDLTRQIKNLGKKIGDLTDGWGKFTEGLVAPSIPKLFKKFGIIIDKQFQRARIRKNGREMEIDILSIGRVKGKGRGGEWANRRMGEPANRQKRDRDERTRDEGRKNNTDVIIAVEVKSNLESRNVDDFKNNLTKFFKFFEEYKGMDLIGVVTGIRMEKDVEKYAQRGGFYVLGPSGETMKILNNKDFRPKIW